MTSTNMTTCNTLLTEGVDLARRLPEPADTAMSLIAAAGVAAAVEQASAIRALAEATEKVARAINQGRSYL